MGRVADLLSAKGNDVHTVSPAATVYDAVDRMVRHNVGSLLVVEGDEIHGIITERDYLREIVLKGRTSRETSVREVMTTRMVCVEPSDTIEGCMAIMTAKRIRHLPVLDQGRLAGLISIGDVVKRLSMDQKAEIRYLTDYITGKYPA
jgi:CBS domain-containing protein